MTREITVKLRDPEEGDECMMCHRRAIRGTAWARYCDVHEAHARPTEGVETMGYEVYRRTTRGDG
jgi:hypothetical protein